MEQECQKAIDLAGGPAKLAAALSATKSITSQAISQWKKVPADRCLEVETVTGVSRHRLRPDVFGAAEEVA